MVYVLAYQASMKLLIKYVRNANINAKLAKILILVVIATNKILDN